MKYIKKPDRFEAFQFLGDDSSPQWYWDHISLGVITEYSDSEGSHCELNNFRGVVRIDISDYIILRNDGIIDGCKKLHFDATYEAV